MPPALPDELALEICKHVKQDDLWLSLRNVNRQFRRCAEDVMKNSFVKEMTIGLNFSLGVGLKHRWYDIRASIALGCKDISDQHALFGHPTFLPESCNDRAMEKWKTIAARGIDCDQAWKLQLAGNDTHYARLPNLVISQQGAWLEWRTLLNAYFRKTVPPEKYWAKQWQAI